MKIQVSGMMCPHCKASVEKACKGVTGVLEARADLAEKCVDVTGTFAPVAVKQAIGDAGFEVVEP